MIRVQNRVGLKMAAVSKKVVALSCRNNASAFIGFFALLPSLSIIITLLREPYVGTSFLPTKALYSHNDICEHYKVLLYVVVISMAVWNC